MLGCEGLPSTIFMSKTALFSLEIFVLTFHFKCRSIYYWFSIILWISLQITVLIKYLVAHQGGSQIDWLWLKSYSAKRVWDTQPPTHTHTSWINHQKETPGLISKAVLVLSDTMWYVDLTFQMSVSFPNLNLRVSCPSSQNTAVFASLEFWTSITDKDTWKVCVRWKKKAVSERSTQKSLQIY